MGSAFWPPATRWRSIEDGWLSAGGGKVQEGLNWGFDDSHNLALWRGVNDAQGTPIPQPDDLVLNDWARDWALFAPPYPVLKGQTDYHQDLTELQNTDPLLYQSYKDNHEDRIFKSDVSFRAAQDPAVAESFEFSIWKGGTPPSAEPPP